MIVISVLHAIHRDAPHRNAAKGTLQGGECSAVLKIEERPSEAREMSWEHSTKRVIVAEDQTGTSPVVIKKYANRRLYNTQTSSYVTLDHLSHMVKEGTEFEVHDARTGEDITRSVLTQIIFEEEGKGQNLLPIKFLRQLIRFYGDSLQAFVPGYLDLSMESFTKNQEAMKNRVAEAFGGGTSALEAMTRQNLAMFERAMKMFSPFAMPGSAGEEAPKATNGAGHAKPDEDINALKSEIEAMRKQLAELARERK
jgi:polyhydroxyalkanoate synthesis repressor PhaR